MDFADATLVHLARRESLSTVFTVDFNDFETYRIEGRKRFSILPHRDWIGATDHRNHTPRPNASCPRARQRPPSAWRTKVGQGNPPSGLVEVLD